MTLNIHLTIKPDDELQAAIRRIEAALQAAKIQGNHIMSKITDFAAQEQADFTTLSTQLDDIKTGIAALDVLITNFQNSPGTLSPEDQAALDSIQAGSRALVTKASDISTTAPVPPAAG